jgi:hypothetical protein
MLAETLKVPFTYCWSPALVERPKDWPPNLGRFIFLFPLSALSLTYTDVCGFFFRNPPSYSPPAELEAFLNAGPPPIYIGFGSIVVEDSAKLTGLIIEAVREAGVRAIVSRGWSDLDSSEHSEDIFFVGDCPHGKSRLSQSLLVTKFHRMAISARFSRSASWWSGYYGMRSFVWSPNHYHTILWRVCILRDHLVVLLTLAQVNLFGAKLYPTPMQALLRYPSSPSVFNCSQMPFDIVFPHRPLRRLGTSL